MNIPTKNLRLDNHTDLDQIIKYYQDETGTYQLTPRQEKKREQLDFCDNLIRNYGSKIRVIPMLMKKFDITKAAADKLYSDTQKAFASVHSHTKPYLLSVAFDWISDARNRAILAGDNKSLAHIVRTLVEHLKHIPNGDGEGAKIVQYIFQYKAHSLGVHELTDQEVEELKNKILKPKKHNNLIIKAEGDD
jgi:hypothetical protein